MGVGDSNVDPVDNSDAIETKILPILNTYYLPGLGNEDLYPSISPVNTFRFIFNRYFGLDYELLEDRSFCSNQKESPYDFVEFPLTTGP